MDKSDKCYEVYREVHIVTEWKDGAVYATELKGAQWVNLAEVNANRPTETNVMYVSMPTDYTGQTFRRISQ